MNGTSLTFAWLNNAFKKSLFKDRVETPSVPAAINEPVGTIVVLTPPNERCR